MAAILLAGCGTGELVVDGGAGQDFSSTVPSDLGITCAPAPDGGDLPCDVAAVLAAKCQPCHRSPPLNHAPWPLTSYEELSQPWGDFQSTGLLKWQRAAQVTAGALPHMPPLDHPQLTDRERATLQAWFTSCARPIPEGSGCDLEDAGPFHGFDLGH